MGEQEDLLREAMEALLAFKAVYRFNEPLAADWPDEKPNSEFIPGGWPVWSEFRKAAEVYAKLEAALDPLARADAALNSGGMAQSHESPPPASGADDGLCVAQSPASKDGSMGTPQNL